MGAVATRRWEAANPHTSFRTVHPEEDVTPDDEEQPSAFEEFKATIESGGNLYNVRRG